MIEPPSCYASVLNPLSWAKATGDAHDGITQEALVSLYTLLGLRSAGKGYTLVLLSMAISDPELGFIAIPAIVLVFLPLFTWLVGQPQERSNIHFGSCLTLSLPASFPAIMGPVLSVTGAVGITLAASSGTLEHLRYSIYTLTW
jgi:hypothetical protein